MVSLQIVFHPKNIQHRTQIMLDLGMENGV